MAGKTGLKENIIKNFLKGLAALLPTVITIIIIVKAIEFINENIGFYVIRALEEIINWVGLLLEKTFQFKFEHPFEFRHPQLYGFILALAAVFFLGRFLTSLIGRKIWGFFERRLEKLPLVSLIYPSVRQITEFLFKQKEEKAAAYKGVVAVEYPRRGIWAVGFVTGEGLAAVHEKTGKEAITIFIPSSPTPLTGYIIVVPKDETIALPFKVEEVFRFIMSGGVITPGSGEALTFQDKRVELKQPEGNGQGVPGQGQGD